MKLLLALVFVIIPSIYGNLMLNTRTILIRPGSAFMQFIKHEGANTFKDCLLRYHMKSKEYNTTIPINSIQTIIGTPFKNRLQSLGRNTCGFKLTNVTKDDPSSYRLETNYTDTNNVKQTFHGHFSITLYEHINMRYTVNSVILGGTATVTCGISNVQISCTMFDPKGNMVLRGKKKCIHEIDHVTREQIGNWTCIPTLSQTMEPLKSIQELRVVKETSVNTWYKEENGLGIIGCKYNIYVKMIKIQYCQFISPAKETFTISQSAGATERYTSLGTDFENNVCQIEFKLPLLDKERGTWKCMIEDRSGGFIYANSERSQPTDYERSSYARNFEVYVKLGSRLVVFCQVPYSSSNCYIKTPAGETILGGNADTFRLGECRTEIVKSNKSHIGLWSCFYSKPDEAVDDVIEVEVKEHYTMKALYKEVEADLGQSVTLMCKATTPIQSCQYVDPRGNSYSVDPKKKPNSVTYNGRGFDYGECGIQIDTVKEEHTGTWSCVINYMGNSETSLKDTIKVTIDGVADYRPTTIASAIGITIGIGLIIVGLIAFVLYKRHKRQNERQVPVVEINVENEAVELRDI